MARPDEPQHDFIWTGPGSLAGIGPWEPVPWLDAVCERCRAIGFTGVLELVNEDGECMVMKGWLGGAEQEYLSGEFMAGRTWESGPGYDFGHCAGFRVRQCVPDLDGRFTAGPILRGRLDAERGMLARIATLCRKHRLCCDVELRRAPLAGGVEVGFHYGVPDRMVVRESTQSPLASPPASPYRDAATREFTAEAEMLAALAELSRQWTRGSYQLRLRPFFAAGA